MMDVAIIPARGGSRRIPRKNVRPLLGRPALSYPIAAALDSGAFARVLVSTEDGEIAAAAHAAGADVIDRPLDLAGDDATLIQVCHHALDHLQAAGEAPDTFCCLFATAVLLYPEDLRRARAILDRDSTADGVIATTDFAMLPLQAFRQEDRLVPMFPEYIRQNSRQHPPLVGDAGAFYWLRTAAFRRQGTVFAERLQGYHLPRDRAVDMDAPEDWRIAECLLRMHQRDGEGEAP